MRARRIPGELLSSVCARILKKLCIAIVKEYRNNFGNGEGVNKKVDELLGGI